MSYDPGRCFWCENMQCDNCNGINEWSNPHASATIGSPCKCSGNHPYKLRPRKQTASADWRRIPLRQCQECPKLVPAAQERCKSHEQKDA